MDTVTVGLLGKILKLHIHKVVTELIEQHWCVPCSSMAIVHRYSALQGALKVALSSTLARVCVLVDRDMHRLSLKRSSQYKQPFPLPGKMLVVGGRWFVIQKY